MNIQRVDLYYLVVNNGCNGRFWNAATMAVVFIFDIFFSIVFVYFNWISIETNSKISSNSTKLVQFQDSTRLNLQYSNNSATLSANSFASCAFIGFDGENHSLSPGHDSLRKHHFDFELQYSRTYHSFSTSFIVIEPFSKHFCISPGLFSVQKWPPMLLTGLLFIAVAELDRISPPCCSWLSEGSK